MSAFTPHNFVGPPKDVANPTHDPNQDAVAALHTARSPVAAFLGIACALAGLFVLYFGRSLILVSACLASVAIVASIVGWRSARKQRRPSGVAAAGLLMGVITAAIVIALSL